MEVGKRTNTKKNIYNGTHTHSKEFVKKKFFCLVVEKKVIKQANDKSLIIPVDDNGWSIWPLVFYGIQVQQKH